MLQYSLSFLRSLQHQSRISRCARRTLFSFHLWRPHISAHYHQSQCFDLVSVSFQLWGVVIETVRVVHTLIQVLQAGLRLIVLRGYALAQLPPPIVHRRSHPSHQHSTYPQPRPSRNTLLNFAPSHTISRCHATQLNTSIIVGGLLNCQSMCNKALAVADLINMHNLSFIVITETWLTGNATFDDAVINDASPPGYQFLHKPRVGKKGGGLAIIIKSTLKIVDLSILIAVTTFEFLSMKCTVASKTFVILAIYRPPSSNIGVFFNELSDFLTHFLPSYDEILIMGDFNLRIASDPRIYSRLAGFLDCFSLRQHVSSPTHSKGDILDLIITRASSLLLNLTGIVNGLADHMLLTFNLSSPSPKTTKMQISKRPFNRLKLDEFKLDMSTLSDNILQYSITNCTLNSDGFITCFHDSLSGVLDRHVPFVLCARREGSRPGWLDSTVFRSRRLLRKSERRWRSLRTIEARQQFLTVRSSHHLLLTRSKMSFLSNQLNENRCHPKQHWKILNSALNRTQGRPLPQHESASVLADEFNHFFIKKILDIKANIPTPLSSLSLPQPSSSNSVLASFELLTQKQVYWLIKNSPKTSNLNDPLPPWLLWRCIPELLPAVTHIVNWSLIHGMPSVFKQAIIVPLLKKPSLDKNEFVNYRPVSNLCFLSKVIERAVVSQTMDHLNHNNIIDPFQSAYRRFHSTETLLTHLHDQVIQHVEDHKVVILVLLDMSAAFDTVDHHLLLQRIQLAGITDSALSWFCSYFKDRTQLTCINGVKSSSCSLSCGVPQGSVLGPILFSLYISGIRHVFQSHNIPHHCYADDIQFFVAAKINELSTAIEQLERCLIDVADWLTQSSLSLNYKKTEIIVFGSKTTLSKCPPISIHVGNDLIAASTNAVRNLGVYFDSQLSMERHINKVSSLAFTNIRLISRIRRALDTSTCKLLVNALVLSHIDYCGSLLYNINSGLLSKLQRIIHASMRLVEQLGRSDHLSHHLKRHGWLSAEARIKKRLLLLIFKVVKGMAPPYLSALIKQPYSAIGDRVLRSQTRGLLAARACRSKLGGRMFSQSSQQLWNELPSLVRDSSTLSVFSSNVEKHLFGQCYQ